MNRKLIAKTAFGLLAAVGFALTLVVASVGAFSQNANSSTTMQNDSGMSMPQENTGGGVNEDLSGTYTGRAMMTGGHEMSSNEATLTITGNTFTLAAEGMSHAGRIYAVNTRRYIGAALIFDDLTDPVTKTPLACSVRVRRTARGITMTPVPGSRNRLTFMGRSSG